MRLMANRRLGVVAAAATAALALGATPAAAAGEWSTTHRSATASGTSSSTYSGLLWTKNVSGNLSVTGEECYRLQLVINHDTVSLPVDVVEQCGAGTVPFSTSRTAMLTPTLSYSVKICRVAGGALAGCNFAVPV